MRRKFSGRWRTGREELYFCYLHDEMRRKKLFNVNFRKKKNDSHVHPKIYRFGNAFHLLITIGYEFMFDFNTLDNRLITPRSVHQPQSVHRQVALLC